MKGKNEKSQSKKFIDAARELGTDDDPEAFKRRLKKLVKAPSSIKERKAKSKSKP